MDLELAQPTAPKRHRTVSASYLPEKQPEPVRAPDASTLEIVSSASMLDYTDSYIAYKLTPERLNWVLREADAGVPIRMYDVFENIVLQDGHTRGLYEQRLDELVVSYTWRAGDERPGSAQAAEELAAATRDLDLAKAIEFLALAPFWGSSYVEAAWVTRADGMQVPAELVCVPHRRFVFDIDTFSPHLTTDKNPWPGEKLERRPGSSWLKAESTRWRRQTQAGALRTVAWWALFKRMSVRDWLIFAERFGIPLIVGKYGKDDSEGTRKALKDAIAALGTEGRAILGGDATIEVLNTALRSASGGGEHLHAGIVQLANSEISKVITAGTLTADTAGPGSFALGQVHADSKHKLSLADAMRIGLVMQRDLGREFLVRNRIGADVASPPFLHIHVQKLSLLADSQVLGNLVKAGLPISIQQVREAFAYRAPTNEADTLKPLVPTESDNADPAGVADPATAPA